MSEFSSLTTVWEGREGVLWRCERCESGEGVMMSRVVRVCGVGGVRRWEGDCDHPARRIAGDCTG